MKEIKLTQGFTAQVDDEDYEWLNQFKWCAHLETGNWYAIRQNWHNNKSGIIRMQRVILNAPYGLLTDHINRDTLDNRKCNLRLCSKAENSRNRKCTAHSSKFKGVSWFKRDSNWRAYIGTPQKHLGYFNTDQDAARAYDEVAKKYHGEFANLNFKHL